MLKIVIFAYHRYQSRKSWQNSKREILKLPSFQNSMDSVLSLIITVISRRKNGEIQRIPKLCGLQNSMESGAKGSQSRGTNVLGFL